MLLLGQKVFARRDEDEAEAEEAEVKAFQDDGKTVSLRFASDGFNRQHVPISEVAVRDSAYDAEVLPRLPSLPEDPKSDERYEFMAQYKLVGNDLFKQGKHEWAIRTYAAAMQQLQRHCYEDAFDMMHDGRAQSTCVACFSNAALCALKLYQFDLAQAMCERGLAFHPGGSELAKLLVRKATALLERPEHTEPDMAVKCLERALEAAAFGDAKEQRPILVLLQKAKKAAKQKQRAADAELRSRLQAASSKGGGGLRLTDSRAELADARHECEQLLRTGHACLLGTHADRCSQELLLGKEHMPGYVAPQRDAKGARAAFAAAEERAREAGLRQEELHALFGLGAAASDQEQWEESAEHFGRYLELATPLEAEVKAGAAGARGGAAAVAAEGEPFCEPPLGGCYACFHGGMALYNLRRVQPGIHMLHKYLARLPSFRKRELTTRDAWGNEIITPLDKELVAHREWIVCNRSEYTVRRMLATLLSVKASGEGEGSASGAGAGGDGECALREACTHLRAMVELAADDEQRQEAHGQLAQLLHALGDQEEAAQHAGTARELKAARERRQEEISRREREQRARRAEVEEKRDEIEAQPLLEEADEADGAGAAHAVEELIAAEEEKGGRIV